MMSSALAEGLPLLEIFKRKFVFYRERGLSRVVFGAEPDR